MVTTARAAMLPALQKLWQKSFGDGPDYTGFLFGHVTPERMLVWLDGKTTAAMLCWQPVDFVLPGGTLRAAYMFGFNTHPDYRGKGIGGELLKGFHQYIFGLGCEAACLAPASESLFDYYGKHGYETLFSIRHYKISAGELHPTQASCVLVPRPLDTLGRMRDRFFGGDGLYARWPSSFLRVIDEECRLRGGMTLRLSCAGAEGYAVAIPDGDRLLLNEFAAPPAFAADALYALQKRFGAKTVEVRTRADYPMEFTNALLPFVMVRWYDEKKQRGLAEGLGRPPYFAHILD